MEGDREARLEEIREHMNDLQGYVAEKDWRRYARFLLTEVDRLKAKLEAFPVTTKDEKDDSYDYGTHVDQWATGDIARMLERFAAADFDHAFHAVLTEAARRLRLRQGEGGRSSNA